MIRHLATYAVAAVLAFAAVGCSTDDDILAQIDHAERIAEEQPEEALAIMRNIAKEDVHGDKDFARYALVYSEICYYNRIICNSDSLTAPMVAYYQESDRHDERARAMYQHALVMEAAERTAEAMHSLMQAEESCREIDNPRLEGLIQRSKGNIYSNDYLFKNALESHRIGKECFERAGLTEHSAYASLDIASTLILMRNYAEAEPTLIEVGDYAIRKENKWLLCEVLHQLTELYMQTEEWTKCENCIALFKEHDALLSGFGHYYCIEAICAAYRGEEAEAHDFISKAKSCDDAIDEEVEYAQYVVYRAFDDNYNALLWHELNKHRQDERMLEVLEQPILNVQVEKLEQHLASERRERELLRQRNVMIYVGITLIIIVTVAYMWYRMRRKNRDIAQYVETIKELQLANRNLPDEMNASIGALYRDRFSELNELCDIYYDHSGSSRQKTLVYDKLSQTIASIKSDDARLGNMEDAVNRYRKNIMANLRAQMPKLSERDVRIALYSFAGFSNRAIALFIDSDPINVSKMKYNLKQKVKKSELKDADTFIAALSER